VTQNVLNDVFGNAAFTQDRRALAGMSVQRWMDLPVEVMDQSQQAPGFRILAELLGVKTHGSFHRKHMADQAFVFYEFLHKC
jgi:hypothetical protein